MRLKIFPRGLRPAAWCAAGLCGAAILAVGAPAFAHHSFAMFDRNKIIELKGTIKQFQWTNPHSWIQIDVADEKGAVGEWSIEAGSPNTLARNGWKPTTFKPGDRVTLKVNPMKDGSKGGAFRGGVLADGSQIGNRE